MRWSRFALCVVVMVCSDASVVEGAQPPNNSNHNYARSRLRMRKLV